MPLPIEQTHTHAPTHAPMRMCVCVQMVCSGWVTFAKYRFSLSFKIVPVAVNPLRLLLVSLVQTSFIFRFLSVSSYSGFTSGFALWTHVRGVHRHTHTHEWMDCLSIFVIFINFGVGVEIVGKFSIFKMFVVCQFGNNFLWQSIDRIRIPIRCALLQFDSSSFSQFQFHFDSNHRMHQCGTWMIRSLEWKNLFIWLWISNKNQFDRRACRARWMEVTQLFIGSGACLVSRSHRS